MKGLEATEFSDNYHDVVKNLKLIYRNKIYEIEKKYRFDEFHGQALRASDIDGVFVESASLCTDFVQPNPWYYYW